MGAIRDLIRRYPVAAIAVVVAAAGLGGWTIYQSQQAQQPAAQAPPIATLPARPPGASPVTPTGPAGQTGSAAPVTPTSPSGAASGGSTSGRTGSGQTAAPPDTAGEGRANPFAPLVAPQGSGPAPAGGGPLPPVPPLPPNGPAGPAQGAAPAAPPIPPYRVVGFLWGDTAFAILEDGPNSYIVGPGDTVTPGTKVVAIDVQREVVRLDRGGTAIDLPLTSGQRSATP
jgi:hypothetical protein